MRTIRLDLGILVIMGTKAIRLRLIFSTLKLHRQMIVAQLLRTATYRRYR